MYGLNNNTGVPYSQQDNPMQTFKKGYNNAKKIFDPLAKLKSNSGWERLTGMIQLGAGLGG